MHIFQFLLVSLNSIKNVLLDRDEDPEFFSTDPDPAQLKKIPDPDPDPTPTPDPT